MRIADLNKFIGKKVRIIFKDGTMEIGILGFTKEFSAKYGWRQVGYFTINNWNFKTSHIKKCELLE